MAQSNEATIFEMNRAICEFMGWEFKEECKDWYVAYKNGQIRWADNRNGLNKIFLKGFNFHDDWNQLMPVVEKIESIENKRFGVCIDVLDTMIMDYKVGYDQGEKIIVQNDIYPDIVDTKISITHAAVYQFIIWLNQQKQNNEAGFDYKSRDWEKEQMQSASEEAIKRMKERWVSEGKRECPDCGLWFKSEGRCPECNPMG